MTLKTKEPHKVYLANDGISRSMLFHMSKSPAHYKQAVETPEESTRAFEFGTAFHMYLLEPNIAQDHYEVVPKLDLRRKEDKLKYAEIIDSGKEVLSEDDYNTIMAMVDSVNSNKYCRVLLSGEKETSYYWDDELTGLRCKCRPDCRTDLKSASVIVDIKTTEDASTEGFLRSVIKYGYDLQVAQYKTGVEEIERKPHKFVFIAVEKNPPYVANILEADDLLYAKGYDDYRAYLGMVKECQTTGNWYGYTGSAGTPNMLGLPKWLAKEYE